MKYWDDFDSKFGFSDGDAVPPDAWAVRYVYVRRINKLAKKKGSAVRVFAFDRPGMHNPLIIGCCKKEECAKVPAERLASGGWVPASLDCDAEQDPAMEDAICEVADEDIGGYVEVTVKVRKEML